MKILIVADTYAPYISGAAIFPQRLGTALAARGHEVAVIAPAASREFSQQKIAGLETFCFPSMVPPFYPSLRFVPPGGVARRMRRIVADFAPDVIHVQSHFFLGRAAIQIAREAGIPVIATNHWMPENFLPHVPLPRPVARWVAARMWRDFGKVFDQVDAITTPTETAAELIRPHLRLPVRAISCGIEVKNFSETGDPAALRKYFGIPTDRPALLFVGRLDPEKCLEDALRAAADALQKTDFTLVLAGKGVLRPALEKLAADLGIQDRVIFTGFVPDEDLPKIYAAADAFIMAGIAELQSIVTMEAMASGLPVLAARAQALPHLVRDGENGFLLGSGDRAAWADAMRRIASEPDLRAKMGARSRELVAAHDISAVIQEFEKLYQTAIERRLPS